MQLHVQAAKRVTEQDVRRRQFAQPQQGPQLGHDVRAAPGQNGLEPRHMVTPVQFTGLPYTLRVTPGCP